MVLFGGRDRLEVVVFATIIGLNISVTTDKDIGQITSFADV